MKTRIFKHWITSLIGAILIIFALVGYWYHKIDATMLLVLISGGCVLFGIKDPFKK